MRTKSPLSLEEKQAEQELSKSRVRVKVTYIATAFIFLVGFVVIIWLMIEPDRGDPMDVYNLILPIAAGIVTYWFATRSNKRDNGEHDQARDQKT